MIPKREKMIQEKISSLEKKDLKFNVFLREVRDAYGMTRRAVCRDTGIGEMALFLMETGEFQTYPDYKRLEALADYYGLSFSYLEKKSREFINNHWQKPPRWER